MANGSIKAHSARNNVQTFGGIHFRCVRRNSIVQLSCAIGYWYADSSDEYVLKCDNSGSGTPVEIVLDEKNRPFSNIEIVDANLKKRITVRTDGKLSTNETLSGVPLRFSGTWLAADAL